MNKPSTTDIETWLEENDPEGVEEIADLYSAAQDQESMGLWEVEIDQNKTMFIYGPQSILVLPSTKARNFLMKNVAKLKDDDELGMESWRNFHRNLNNPKA